MRTTTLRFLVAGLVLVSALALLAVVLRDPGGSTARPRESGRDPGRDLGRDLGRDSASPVGRGELLREVYRRFDPGHPGRGVADYPGFSVEDVPKSYAMILLAELERRRDGLAPALPDLSRTAGRWLLDHAATNARGTVGWGLPVAWDAYGDGTVNPPGTIYSISTGIVVDALTTWMLTDPRAPRRRIVRTVSEALDNFAAAPTTPAGLIPYSLAAADRTYDTFNSAVYLAGQMQRFVPYAGPSLARRLAASADATVRSAVRHHLTSPSGAWYWRYSLQEEISNDMPHASYIVEGLRSYVDAAGALADEVDLPAVRAHLADFFDGGGRPRAWPTFQTDLDRPPRLYDVGNALALGCTEPGLRPLARRLLATIDSYGAPDGSGFYKYPVGTPDQAPLVVNEYEAYLWRGLVTCTAGGDAGGR